MDKGTGTIIVAKPLDAEQRSNYNLTVEATDGTNTIHTQVSEVRVCVCQRRVHDTFGTSGSPGESATWGSQIRSYYDDIVHTQYMHTKEFYSGEEN